MTPPTIGPTLLDDDEDLAPFKFVSDDDEDDAEPLPCELDTFFAQYVLGHSVHESDVVAQYSSSAHCGQVTLLSQETHPSSSELPLLELEPDARVDDEVDFVVSVLLVPAVEKIVEIDDSLDIIKYQQKSFTANTVLSIDASCP